MNPAARILVLNPGSTRTRIALFEGDRARLEGELLHPASESIDPAGELELRLRAVREFLADRSVTLDSVDAVVGRGGLLRPLEGGVYRVNRAMLEDASVGLQGRHPANLGAPMANALAGEAGVPAFVVDPVSVDEFDDVARLSGLAGLQRRSLSHALSIHASVRELARTLDADWRELRVVVCHLGGGISVCPVRDGRIVDANNAVSEGPFSPQRSGGLPVQELLDLVYSGEHDEAAIRRMTVGAGGLVSYLGTDDASEVERRVRSGDSEAERVFRGMAYQVSKEIGAMATVLHGRIDAIVLTGGLAGSEMLVEWIRGRVEFLAPVHVLPVAEMAALAAGARAALTGKEPIRDY